MSTEIQVDDETRAALLLFNERVEASAAAERGKKRIAKAERAKDEAAKAVRDINNNPDATPEQKAEAEAAYKEASDNFVVVKADPLAGEQKKSAPKAEAEAPAEVSKAEAPAEVSADEAPAEVSADEEGNSAPDTSTESE